MAAWLRVSVRGCVDLAGKFISTATACAGQVVGAISSLAGSAPNGSGCGLGGATAAGAATGIGTGSEMLIRSVPSKSCGGGARRAGAPVTRPAGRPTATDGGGGGGGCEGGGPRLDELLCCPASKNTSEVTRAGDDAWSAGVALWSSRSALVAPWTLE